MDEYEARRRIESMTASDRPPVLTSDELDDLVDVARRADTGDHAPDTYVTWKAALALAVGALVVPSARNGHVYEVTVSDGAAGAVEPVWPTEEGETVTADGVTYEEAGAALWTPTWDLNRAAAAGWEWKAGKATPDFDFSDDAGTYSRQQVFEMCKRQARDYAKKTTASIPLSRNELPASVV